MKNKNELLHAAADFAAAYWKLHVLLSLADDGTDRWHDLVFTDYPLTGDFDESITEVQKWAIHIMECGERN